MSISEQVKELRKYSELCLQYCNEKRAKELLSEAADTIEALSAKLQAANEELERWHTDHINEKIKNPFAYTSTLICHNCDHKDEYIEELEAELEEMKAVNTERPEMYYGGGKIKLSDLKYIISKDSKVGITSEDYDDLPIVDTWGNWINGGFKTLDVEVTRITSCAYILLELKVDGD